MINFTVLETVLGLNGTDLEALSRLQKAQLMEEIFSTFEWPPEGSVDHRVHVAVYASIRSLVSVYKRYEG